MHDATDICRTLFIHQPDGVLLRVARVDNQRLVGLFGCANMVAKTRALPFQVTFEAIVIQTGFAGGNDFRVSEHANQLFNSRFVDIGIIGVRADRAINMRMHFDNGFNSTPV